MIAVCKRHPKFTETGTSAGGEGQEYEEVDGGGGGVALSDPTLMEEEKEEKTCSNSRRMMHMPVLYTNNHVYIYIAIVWL